MCPSETLDLLFLDHPQELGLKYQRDVAYLIKKDGSLVGKLEFAGLTLVGAGEGALFVTEELAFQERLGDSCAVHLDEGELLALAERVDHVEDDLLSDTALAAYYAR
ncbi:MAG: hypothetical protein A4E61_00106 [Syntrophorhabdus sp. PtaB.Bin184]|nr:MAG: hypothetical protein A4E61_00106 [Syntrophorhabdus sp. PtaB.Bin184]